MPMARATWRTWPVRCGPPCAARGAAKRKLRCCRAKPQRSTSARAEPLSATRSRPRTQRQRGRSVLRLVFGDRLGEVLVFLAGLAAADLFQFREVLLRFGRALFHQVGLADVLVRALVAWVELERR